MSATVTATRIPFLDLKAQYHSIKPEIDAAVVRVLETQPVRPRRGGRGVRARVRGPCGAAHGDRGQLRHQRPPPRAARRRRRAGRRGHHRPVHVRRHGCGHPLRRRARRCSSTSTPSRSRWTRRGSRRRSRRGRRRSCRCTSTGSRPTWTRSSRSRRRRGLAVDRGRRPRRTARDYKGRPRREHGRPRLLQLLPRQEPRRLRRGRRGRHRQRRPREEDPHAPRLGRGEAVPPRPRRASTTAWRACRARSCASSCATSRRGPRRAARMPRATTSLLADAGLGLPRRVPWARHVYHVYAVQDAASARRSEAAQRPGRPDRDPLPDPRAPPAGLRRPRVGQGRVPERRDGGRRGSVAPDVPGNDGGAPAGGGAGRPWPVGPASSRR